MSVEWNHLIVVNLPAADYLLLVNYLGAVAAQ
jgi:hypothetical protein